MDGGAEGDRTLDLRIANATLSQLSYRPTEARDSSIRWMRRNPKSVHRTRPTAGVETRALQHEGRAGILWLQAPP